MQSVWLKIMIALGLVTTIGIGTASGKAWLLSLYRLEWEGVNFEETSEYLENPDCGWYEIYGYELGDDVNLGKTLQDHLQACDDSAQLVQIQVNLRQYRDRDISEIGLQELEDVLSAWENSHRRIILRFLYDWSGHGLESEPDDLQQVCNHMNQVASVVNAHKDAIYTLQGIFVGDVGEMHGSKFLDAMQMRVLMQTMNDAFDPNIYLAVRTPEHRRMILQESDVLDASNAYDGTLNSRLGLFNDGMMGSALDLGTYGDTELALDADYKGKGTRDEELEYQNKRCAYVPNGGEAVLSNPYNDCPAAYETLSQMHVSYLNRMHHDEVLNKWKNTPYQGAEEAYRNLSAYDYIGTHLGYRYVIRDAQVAITNVAHKEATVTLQIANVGFAPAYRKYDMQLVVTPQEQPSTEVVLLDWDNRTFAAGEVTEVSTPLSLMDHAYDTYDVYLETKDPLTGASIQFANADKPTECGYYLGSFTLEQLYGE